MNGFTRARDKRLDEEEKGGKMGKRGKKKDWAEEKRGKEGGGKGKGKKKVEGRGIPHTNIFMPDTPVY